MVGDLTRRAPNLAPRLWRAVTAKRLCEHYGLPNRHPMWRLVNATLAAKGLPRVCISGARLWRVPLSAADLGEAQGR